MNGAEGVTACRAALALYPDTPRFEFQLARSLQKTGANDESAALYRSLVERGYFAALTNYGWMLNNGLGVAKDQKAAVHFYLLAAHQGDNFGMFNTAMAYDTGEGLPYDSGAGGALALCGDPARPRLLDPDDGRAAECLDARFPRRVAAAAAARGRL